MVYFSRLTDIVTCSLSNILEQESDKKAAIEQIIAEMEEGLAGARRSVETASNVEKRLCDELDEHQTQITNWLDTARKALSANNETDARKALQRKQEEEHIVAGLQLQHKVSTNTLEHLSTTMRALEGRLAEAQRKQQEITGTSTTDIDAQPSQTISSSPRTSSHDETIEQELANLKRELGVD